MSSDSESMSISPQPQNFSEINCDIHREGIETNGIDKTVTRQRSRSRSPPSLTGHLKGKKLSSHDSSVSSDDMFIKTPEPAETTGQVRIGGELEDASGYYVPQVGEVILDNETNSRLKILSIRGKGVFSCVVEVENLETSSKLALKLLRSSEMMQKSGEKERKVLEKLNTSDPFDHRHIIRLFGSFIYSGHLCLKYELMFMSLREVLQKFGNPNGLSLKAVQSFSRQGFLALHHLKLHKMIHSDIKPDNILICSQLRKIKLSDFGSTLEEGENKITENLVARYYRPPEIYLGCPYDSSVDVWSFACTLFELFTGKVLFPGNSDSHMMKLIMEVKGPIPKKMRTQGKFVQKFFEDFSFVYCKNELEGPVRVPLSELKKEKNLGVALEPTLKIGMAQGTEQDYAREKKDVIIMEIEQKLEDLIENTDLSSLTSPYLSKTFSLWRHSLVSGDDQDLDWFIEKVDHYFLPKFLKKVAEAYTTAIRTDPSLSGLPDPDQSVTSFVNILVQWSVELELAVDLVERARSYKLFEIPHGYQNLFKELKDEWREHESYSQKFSMFFFKYLGKAAGRLKTIAEDSIKGNVMQNMFQAKGSILISVCYAYVCKTMPWPLLTLLGTQCSWIFSSVVISKVGQKVCEKIEDKNLMMKIQKLQQELEKMTSDLMNRNEKSSELIKKAAGRDESDLIRLAEHFNKVLNHHQVEIDLQKEFDEDVFVAEHAVITEQDGWFLVQPYELNCEMMEDWMVVD